MNNSKQRVDIKEFKLFLKQVASISKGKSQGVCIHENMFMPYNSYLNKYMYLVEFYNLRVPGFIKVNTIEHCTRQWGEEMVKVWSPNPDELLEAVKSITE